MTHAKKTGLLKNAILLLATAMSVALFLFYNLVYNKPHPDYVKMAAEVEIPASELYARYVNKKSESEKLYNGKLILINGKAKKTEHHAQDAIVVFVFAQGDFGDQGIRCTLDPKAISDTTQISPGKEIRIKGYCTGFNDTDVIFEKCSVEKD